MTDQQHRTILDVDDPLDRGNVILGGSERHLHDRDLVVFRGQAVIDVAPGAAVDVGAMHKHDVLRLGERRA